MKVTMMVRVLLGMATTVALITRRVGGTKRKYSMAEGEGLGGRREGRSPGRWHDQLLCWTGAALS